MKTLIFLSTILFLPIFNTFAGGCSSAENKLAVFFSNGMLNDKKDVKESLKALINKTKSILESKGYTLIYDIAYNENEDWYYQLVEVFKQKTAEPSLWDKFWLWLTQPSDSPEWFQEELRKISREASEAEYVADDDLRSHVASYRQAIEECNRLMIVAHSQGNFYANSAWDIIYGNKIKNNVYEMRNFPVVGLLSVATPSSRTGTFLLTPDDHQSITEYISLTNDWIINTVRVISSFIGTLKANYTNTGDDPDFKHHAFTDSYLEGDVTGPALIGAIKNIVDRLETLPLDRTPVSSSSLKSVGYFPRLKLLEIEFLNDKSIYRYYNVSWEIYDELMSAYSHGTYFYHNIRSVFPYKQVYAGI